MIKTLNTYINQRFKGIMFIPLGIYLLVYSIGIEGLKGFSWSYIAELFLWIMSLLFIFRVFDDLQSIEADRGKKDRIYTLPANLNSIWILFTLAACLGGIFTFIFIPDALIHFITVILLGMSAYFFQANLGKLSFITPLTKYALIVLTLGYYIHQGMFFHDIIASIAILMAFIAYELIEDDSIRLDAKWENWAIICMLILCLLMANSSVSRIIMISISILFFGLYTYSLLPRLHYFVLIILLLLRLISYAF